MKLTYSVFLLFAVVGVYYAQAASLASETDVSDTPNASSGEGGTTAGNYSGKVQDGETQETHYEKSDLDTGVEEDSTVKEERAEQVTATMNVTSTTTTTTSTTTTTPKESHESESDVDPNIQGDIELLCNNTTEEDRDTARQKRQHSEEYDDYGYEPTDDTE